MYGNPQILLLSFEPFLGDSRSYPVCYHLTPLPCRQLSCFFISYIVDTPRETTPYCRFHRDMHGTRAVVVALLAIMSSVSIVSGGGSSSSGSRSPAAFVGAAAIVAPPESFRGECVMHSIMMVVLLLLSCPCGFPLATASAPLARLSNRSSCRP